MKDSYFRMLAYMAPAQRVDTVTEVIAGADEVLLLVCASSGTLAGKFRNADGTEGIDYVASGTYTIPTVGEQAFAGDVLPFRFAKVKILSGRWYVSRNKVGGGE